jgi:GNAT superfamily N-acetyltransferase
VSACCPALPEIEIPSPRAPRFLLPGASRARLERAAAANHTAWFQAWARAAGGEACRTDGVQWAVTAESLTVTFPRLTHANADSTLNFLVAEFFQRNLNTASCWSLLPSHPRDLGVRLAARGFEWGWQPHWMAMDLRELPTDYALPEGLRITVEDDADWEVKRLPHFDPASRPRWLAMARNRPRRVWHFAAWLDGKIVGHSILHVTTGALGVAGIYSVGVVPSARRLGIGRAVSLAPCLFAQALGCHYALLNSAADFLYEPLGFQHLGYGQTWWMHREKVGSQPPSPDQIAFAEAIGRSDLPALDSLRSGQIPEPLDAPLPCGMTPIELAVRSKQPASADWLVRHGAALDILQAWELGWPEQAQTMLAENPALVNRRRGDWQTTPLHEAILDGDISLVRLLLTFDPDLTVEDAEFHSTPLGWAKHFQREDIITLLEQHLAKRKLP